MARLIIKTEGLGKQALELRMGVNRVGRGTDCEQCLPHTSVSTHHAELALTNDGVYLRDNDSTNGTFINGEPVAKAWLVPGQEIRFGEVKLLVESIDAIVAIPQFDRTEPVKVAAMISDNGQTACRQHPERAATFRCPKCQEHMCNGCVRVMRLKGRPPHFLCRICSHHCDRIEDGRPKRKKGFFAQLQENVKLKFTQPKVKQE